MAPIPLIPYIYGREDDLAERSLLLWGLLLVLCIVGLFALFFGDAAMSTIALGAAAAVSVVFLWVLVLLSFVKL